MGRLLVVGEIAPDGTITKLSTEVATLARDAGRAAGRGVGRASSRSRAPMAAAAELATYLPSVVLETGAPADGSRRGPSSAVAGRRARRRRPRARRRSPDGRDLAGALSALTGWGVLVNATAVRMGDDGPLVEQSVFGGKLSPTGSLHRRPRHHHRARRTPRCRRHGPPGSVTTRQTVAAATTAPVAVVDRITRRARRCPSMTPGSSCRVVAGSAGPRASSSFEELAEALGGAVGASRAAVDSGWIPYAQQIGQTGKIVKPQLYLALGISGAIQHKVGMQTAEAIVAVNRDPDAPIADFADVLVVGDLFEVGRAMLDELRARSG